MASDDGEAGYRGSGVICARLFARPKSGIGGAAMFQFLNGVVLIAVMILAFDADPALASNGFNLRCNLVGPSGEHQYAFHIEIPTFFGKSRITWVGTNTFDLKVVRFDDTTIIASLDTKLSGWPDKADLMQFQLNRITGNAELDYLQKPTETDPWPGFLVMEAFSERGTCSKSERAF